MLLSIVFSAVLGFFAGSKFTSRIGALIAGIVCGLLGLALHSATFVSTNSENSEVVEALINAYSSPAVIGSSMLIGVMGASFGFKRRIDNEKNKKIMDEINSSNE